MKKLKLTKKQKQIVGAIIVVLSALGTWYYGTDAEKEVQEAVSVENVKEIIKEQIQEAIETKPDSVGVDSVKSSQ